ncbi:ATP-binding response regulator [Lignipirellula cremea]|uniref:Transcriptional regulatory protein ZraR n=1 Tax=Lignipirellula cremea TaxID=2528010 RepID=A0A518DRL4_9BACT|nr:response regulator [Lignipirellula cremea]QDU94463.1 Transcriptional regulatory protein ZraR [Lignipirellula cremea]
MQHILVVEDSATQAIQIQLFLKQAAYRVSLAGNGLEALQAIEKEAPDLVLTDMQMPEMDGLELVGQMRLTCPQIPVILMTAEGSDELAVEALAQGAAGYVPKSKLHALLPETIEHTLSLMHADRRYARLVGCIEKQALTLSIPNDPEMIDILVDLLQQMAEGIGLCDAADRVRLGSALEHALLNAIFRGNLEITREQMEQESVNLLTGEEAGLVDRRRSNEPYCNRKVFVDAVITQEQGKFIIRDEGPGFDHAAQQGGDDQLFVVDQSGRGLLLMRSFMDEVIFNARGNEVTLIRKASPPRQGVSAS